MANVAAAQASEAAVVVNKMEARGRRNAHSLTNRFIVRPGTPTHCRALPFPEELAGIDRSPDHLSS